MDKEQSKLGRFWHEIKRRKIVQVVIVYAPAAFILIQLVDIFKDDFNLPDYTMRLLVVLLAVGFVIAVIFSWIFDVSSKGITKTEPEPEKELLAKTLKPVPEKSIIVLPFDNLSSDPEQDYFSDGLTEEIITDLSYIKDLLVISRSSAMTFKGSKQTLKKIASKVNVRYVLEGSVRKSGNDLRIIAQLIDAQTDTHLWAEKYAGKLDDIFDIQEKVSRSVSESLKVKLQSEESEKISEHKTDNIHVYECYLRARQNLWKYTDESLTRAEQNLKDGLDLFGRHELLYAGLGHVYFQFYDSGLRYDPVYLNKVEENIAKIFDLNPDSAYGYFLSGLVKLKKETGLTAFRDFQKSYELNPSNPETLFWYATTLIFHLGQPEKAKPVMEKLLLIDPLTPVNQMVPALIHWLQGQLVETLYYMRRYYQKEPESVMASWYLGQLLVITRSNDAAEFVLEKWKSDSKDIFYEMLMWMYHAFIGDKTEALKYINESTLMISWDDGYLSWFIAGWYALLDEKELAMKYIERIHEKGMINYPLLAEHDPLLENIRNEPRFKKLLKTVKKEWEEFDV